MKTKTPEELKLIIDELKAWAPNDMEPRLKVVHSAALIRDALDAIEFLTGPPIFEWIEPEIIAKETITAEVCSPWPKVMELEDRLNELADRVTTSDNNRYEQTRTCRDDMLNGISSLWSAMFVYGVILTITALVLVYHISAIKH